VIPCILFAMNAHRLSQTQKNYKKEKGGAFMQEIILGIIAVSCFILFTITTIKTRGRGKVYYILGSLIVLAFLLVTYISKYL
ncbi:hypothetical protein, partial [Bacillus siamensis]|uniref:hypothetical protein n=1 Tax=Bacillus siamensis TaxID=659243 RepID=UPI0039E069FA